MSYKTLSKLLFTDEEGRYCIIGAGSRVNVESYWKRIVITRVKLKQLDDFAATLFTMQNLVTIDRKQLLIAKYRKEISNGSESNKYNNLCFNDLDDEDIIKFYEKIKDHQIHSFYGGLIKRLKSIISTSGNSCRAFGNVADKYMCVYIKKILNQIYQYNY